MIKDFLRYQAQTTSNPLKINVSSAKGTYIYDENNCPYLDFVSGVSACTLGHCHPEIVKSIQNQAEKYIHVMVYGEYVQSPAVKLSKLLAQLTPLEVTYLVNSGTEAIEGAMKLAKKATQRTQIIAAKNAYHGNTQGSMSLMSFKDRKSPFLPLLPDTSFIEFNNEEDLEQITERTAAVVLETIQGGAGMILPEDNYLKKVRLQCDKVGALLILDEIQSGFGRTGKLFAFQHFNVIPDILVMGKGMASGMPVGAFMSSQKLMNFLSNNPPFGHITTFGGHPVIAASALKTLQILQNTGIISDVEKKETRIRKKLRHPKIQEIRGKGLMLALIFESEDIANTLILKSLEKKLILFWLLFEKKAVRISPSLIISNDEIDKGCQIILDVLETF